MHLPLLDDILVLLSFSVVIVFLLQRVRLPSILGFLITGVIIGPYGLSLVNAIEEVEIIAEIGVILLLFVIGMELSIKQLASIKKTVFIGGALQVGLTVIIAGAVYYYLGYAWNESLFVGFLFSLSSTAIVLTMFQGRNEIASPHGKNALGILIFQDIIVVPMMLVTPIMAGQSDDVTMSIVSLLIKTIVVIVITIVSARYVVPRLMHTIAKTQSKELFLLTTIAICFAVAFLTSQAGLSLALGAFLAGLIISESEYSHQATSIILPFRELFTSFFFISVGMLLDLSFFIQNIGIILIILVAVLLIKSTIASVAVAILNYPPRTALLTGLSLFQVGEFAFILSKVGIEYGLLSETTNQYFLAVSIVSMLLTPFVIILSEKIIDMVLQTGIGNVLTRKTTASISSEEHHDELNNHLVIIGYGINGSNLAKAARFSDIPYVVIELNAQTVKRERDNNIPIYYGDATQPHILETVNLHKARAVVIAISDPKATKVIIGNIRSVSQSVFLLVRTRYVREISELLSLGADDVIPEEFETSVEIFSRVLHNFLVPSEDIAHFIESVRSDNYELFQNKKTMPRTFKPSGIAEFKITCIRVTKDSGSVVGHTLDESNVRYQHGVNVVAISRRDQMLYDIQPDEKIQQNDLLYVHGLPEKVESFHKLVS